MSRLIELLGRQHEEVLARIDRDIDGFGAPEIAADFLAYLEREVVDHMRLEEEQLFPHLAGLPAIAAGPLRLINAEHAAFRELLADGSAARRRRDCVAVSRAAHALAVSLRGHIAREDGVLFPMALDLLTAAQKDSIDAALSSS